MTVIIMCIYNIQATTIRVMIGCCVRVLNVLHAMNSFNKGGKTIIAIHGMYTICVVECAGIYPHQLIS